MSQHRRISRISIASIALCVVFVTLVVARSPIAKAGTPQGTIVPSPNQPGPPWSIVTSPNATTNNNYLNGTSCTSTSFCIAAGYSVNAAGTIDQTLIEEWNGTSWSIVTSPNTSTTQNNVLYGVSCTSTTFCMAAGGYVNAGSYYQTLIEEWNGTSWSIVTSPNTSTTQDNYLTSVSCVSASDCMAAGYYYTGHHDQTLIEEWNGTGWSIVTSPNTSTSQNNLLNGVSCTSTSFCMAAGYYGGTDQTLIEEWNGTSWSIVTSPNTSTTENNYLQSVSCTSATFCMAAGFSANSGGFNQTLVEEWNGTGWSIVTSPNTSTTENNEPQTVSCTSTTFCMAAGGYVNAGSYYQTLIEEWNGTSWSIVTSPNTSTAQTNELNATSCTSTSFCMAAGEYVNAGSYYQTLIEEYSIENNTLYDTSCTSATFCIAAGYYVNSSGYDQTLIEEWNGTAWSIVTSTNTSVVQNNVLYGVSCTSTTFCTVAGYYVGTGTPDQTLIEEWNGTAWSISTSADTSTSQTNILNDVSCASGTFCMAVGDYIDSSGYNQTLVEQWNGTSWSIVSSPNTSTTQTNNLNGVSCTSTSFCMAVGYAPPSGGGANQTLVEEWNGSAWSIVSSPNTSTTQNNYLFEGSCTSTSFCMAAGNYVSSSGNQQTLIEDWNGTSWSIVTSPNTSTTQNNDLYGVSCTSTSFCMASGVAVGSSWQTLVEEWNGSAWSIVTSPDTSTTQNNQLNSVSCVSVSDCMAVGYYVNTGGYDQTLIEEFTMVCSGGSLGLTAPTSAPFSGVTLNGTSQTSTLPLTFTPDDETGTGNGWNIAVTSTTFTNASSDTLPTSASTVTGVGLVTLPTGNCSAPTNTISPYPITVPAGSTAPTAVAIYSANTGTGEGPSDVTLNFAVAVPGNTYSGTYSSTWTFTIANGP